MALTSNSFAKCAPNISTNIKQCGSVTLCSAKPLTEDQLTDTYTTSGEYKVMEALFLHDMEIKQCEAVQNGLYDFFMSNKVPLTKGLTSTRMANNLIRIAPFVMARQYSPINNEYWAVSNGQANGENWQVDVQSTTNIPADVRSFPADQRVYISGLTGGGINTKTAWKIISSALVGSVVRLVLQGQNDGSYLPVSRLQSPTTGLLTRGTANKSDFEKYCQEPPAYLNWKNVPFWTETQRTNMCRSKQYDDYRALLLEDNALYREFGDLDETQKNKQLAADWQKRMVNTFMWGSPISADQTLAAYDGLEDIETFMSESIDIGTGGQCVGKRANMVGIYEQHAQCNRVMDLQGARLNLVSVFNALYNIIRVRENNGNSKRVEQIDIFTDSITAEAVNQAMIAYYNAKSQNTLRLTLDINQDVKKAEFGFNYRSYNLFYPTVRINIVSHYYFDDELTAATSVNSANMGRHFWILDFAGIYPGILATNRLTNVSGNDLKTLASIDASYACVMKVNWQEQTLTSVTGTMIVECPAGNLLIDNFDAEIPLSVDANPPPYPPTTTTTTTTTTAP